MPGAINAGFFALANSSSTLGFLSSFFEAK
jgi:hypothetical protein